MHVHRDFVVIGGGPAGLTAAYESLRCGVKPLVLEKEGVVGGIARTEQYKGYHFDMGGHRFFTKVPEVERMWREVLGDDLLRRARLSRIFYNGKFFNYPLKPLNTLFGLGPLESVLILFSYVRWKLFPYQQEETFEQWVTNRFGKRLFLTFFKTYTEKVWGISCSELKAEWAAQRIMDLSLRSAVLGMFFKPRKLIKTLIDSFDYPRLGPGMMWNAVRERVIDAGGDVQSNSEVTAIHRRDMRVESVTVGYNGELRDFRGKYFVSSMPVSEFIARLVPPAPPEVRQAAAGLKYRDFLTVCLIVNRTSVFPDNWIYVHDPSVRVGRIQNFKNWSPAMVPDESMTSLGLEYFCNEGEALWMMPDHDLVELAKRELQAIGMVQASDVQDGCVFRVPKSYPVYDSQYAGHLAILRRFIDDLENCRTIGRNGLHRYNNQDHSMLTGMYAVRDLLRGETHDLWSVNADREYHEESRRGSQAGAGRPVGITAEDLLIEEGLSLIFARLDKLGVATAVGTVLGLGMMLGTLILLLKGGSHVGANLVLMSQFFPGYRVTGAGSLVGLAYGFVAGFVVGWVLAALRNIVSFMHWIRLRRQAEWTRLWRVLEYV